MPAGPCHAFSRSSPALILPTSLWCRRLPTDVRTICPSPGFPCTMHVAWCIQPAFSIDGLHFTVSLCAEETALLELFICYEAVRP